MKDSSDSVEQFHETAVILSGIVLVFKFLQPNLVLSSI
jgi:hypothetical protein